MTKLFQPTQNHIKSSNLYFYEDYLNQNYKKKFKNYSQLWNWSVINPIDFWKSITEFYRAPLTKNKNSKPEYITRIQTQVELFIMPII